MMKKWILISLLVVGAIICGVVAVEYQTGTLPGELGRLERKGKRMEAQIEEFKLSHGQYPSSLGQAGIFNTKTRFGDWRYEASTNRFTLTVGDYSHGFVFGYSSWAGWWCDR